MKTLVVVTLVSCLVLGVTRGQELTDWHVEWTAEPAYNLSAIEPFADPGFLLPDLNISDIISTVGMMYQAEDVVHAIGSLCVQMGPRLNWLTDGAMQELCEPVLEALRNGSYAQAYSICRSSLSFIETLFGGEEEEGGEEHQIEGEVHEGTGGEVAHGTSSRMRRGFSIPTIDLGPLPDVTIPNITIPDIPDLSNITIPDLSNITIPNLPNITSLNTPNITVPFSPIDDLDFNWTNPIFDDITNVVGNIGLIPYLNRNWSFPMFDGTDFDFPNFDFPGKYEICSGLAGLIYDRSPSNSVFGVVLKVIVAEQVKSIPGKCLSLYDGEEGSGDMGGEPFFGTEPDTLIGAFATLGGFDDIEQICNVSSWALLMRDEGNFELFNELVNQISTSTYNVITNRSRCIDFADSFHANIGLAPGNYSRVTDSEALCYEVLDSFYWRGNMSEIDFYKYEDMDEGDALIHLLSVVEILSHKSDTESLEFLCRMSPHTDERFCSSLGHSDYRDVSKESIIEQCMRYTTFDWFDFDFIALLRVIGAEFDFDFYDSSQTCSHLKDIIFDNVIRQEYTIDNVLRKGMKVIGRVLAPMFCDLQSFRNISMGSLEPPCSTPGNGCYNWTSRGEDYFYDHSDVGFIVGTIFSYLGGYRDGDHICHQMAFALEDDTLLDMVAGTLRDSVFRMFDDPTFCSDTIELITRLTGVDRDVAQTIGFNNTGALCWEISEIYSKGGPYNVSFEPLLALFTSGEEGEEVYVRPEAVMHVTVEMMKFAAMVMHSDNIGDALSKSCQMWQATGLGFTVFEVDDLCRTVLALNPEELENVCIHDIIPYLDSVLGRHDGGKDEEEEGEDFDFDFAGLLDTIGDEFGFDFYDSSQSCSRLTEILFDDSIRQEYPIDNVVVRGMRAFGKIASPIFCDLESFNTHPGFFLEPACATPGPNCFNWTGRGEEFFYQREDVGFILGTIFSYLGGYRDGDHLCHQMAFALEDDTQLNEVANKLKDSMFRILEDPSFCSGTMDIISNLIGAEEDLASILGFENSDAFCGTINQIYNENGDYEVSLEPVLELFIGGEEEGEVDPSAIMNATIEMIKFAAMLVHSDNIGDAASKTCLVWQASGGMLNITEIDDLCRMVLEQDSAALYQVCINEVFPFLDSVLDHHDGGKDEEEEEEFDFDFAGLLDTIGDEFGFDFYDSSQSCSRLTDILFDDSIRQEYPIDNVVVRGMRAFGKIASPIFCDLESFNTHPGSFLEPACETPGPNCFNWTGRGEEFFYQRDDVGFILGTIFSYLGGYRDGDHLCHQMAFALEDDTQLNEVANKLKDSIFRILEDPSFCSGTMDIISNLVGADEDLAGILGFENSDAFCGTINQIYNENGDYEVSLEPVLELFIGGEEEGDVDPSAIMNATIEMIKFAAMLVHSDNIGDAASKMCLVWQSSGGMLNITEIDDLCHMVLEQDSAALYQVCTEELFPLIEPILEGNRDDDNDTPTFVDLADIEICLDNGEVTFDAFENLDILAYLLQTAHKLYNLTEFDENGICRAVTNVVQSRKDIPTLISEFAVEWMSLFMPVGAEICSCWDQVFSYLFSESEDFGVNQFNELVLIAVNSIGLDSHHELCDHLIHLTPNNMSEYAESVVDEILDFVANPSKCACTANRVLDFVLPLVNVSLEELNSYMYQYLGFPSVDHVCSFVAYSFSGVSVDPSTIDCSSQQEPPTEATASTQSPVPVDNAGNATAEEEVCLFIRDCAGVCNGDAEVDCAGVCGGTAELDCAFVCGGQATTNDCGWCVGGNTGRPITFRVNQCGSCIGEGTVNIDCNGDCNGTAYRDACQVCVGGNTGVAEDVSDRFLDCRGVCNGSFVTNDCDECVLPFSDGTIFSTQDCNGDCNGFAEINQCDYCVGGNTGNPVDTGFSECGVCNSTSDPDFCLGCDGVANSGLVTDACDVCDGDGSTCFTVDSIAPSIIPSNTDYQVKLRGAGFQDATTKQCKFLDDGGEQVSAVDITNEVGDEFNCTANLPEGTYSVYLSTESTELSEEFVTLYVYPEITINSISQSEFDIDDSVASISVSMVSTDGAFTAYKTVATPRAIIFTETERLVIEGSFGGDNDELLEFSGPMLETSAQVVIYPSFNGIDNLGTPDDAGFTITYYAPAPVAQELKFAPTGHLLELEFDVAINEEAVTSCDAIFMNTTSLGAYAQCYAFPFLKTIYILPFSLDSEVNLIGTGDELVLQSDVLQKRDEEYARYASGTLAASSPDEAVTVSAVLTGTESISSCGNVRLSALQSFGNAGRAFAYQWSVTSGGTIPTDLTDALTAAEDSPFVTLDGSFLDADVSYTFSVTAENFLGSSDTKSLDVTRSALNKPDVVIYPERVDPDNALISQPFYLRASVKFYQACGGAEQMEYAWSVDDDSIALNLQTINKPLLYVAAGTLPGDSQVTFTLEVNRASDPDTVTTQTVTINTIYSDLVALIDGGSERTIGVDSDSFTLDGSSSYDPDNENEEMTYLWTCQKMNTETGSYEPCVSSETREVFPAEADSKASTLTLAANNLYSDSTYVFTLEITKLSRTASASVTILAKAGNPPTISLGELLPDKIKSSSSHTLQVFITHTSDISLDWATVDTDQGNGYVDFSQLNSQSFLVQGTTSPFFTYAFVTIPAETLEEGVSYSFSVTITDAEGQVSASKLTTSTYGGVSSCTFGLVDGATSYQELDEITLLTQNCVTDEEAYPLSYQVFREKVEAAGTRYNALTGALAEASITVLGLPAYSNDQNTFVIKVCNDFGSCSLYSLTLDVTAITSFSQAEFDESVANLVEPQKLSGNYLDALVNYNTITAVGVSETSRKRRAAVTETSTTAAEQLDLLQNAISSTVLDTATAQTLLDQSDSVVVAELTLSDMDTFLDILVDLVAVFSDEELPESSAEIVLTKTSEIAADLDPQYNSDMLDKITTLRNTLVQGQLSQIPLGGDPTETRTGSVTTRAFYVIPSDTLATSSDNTSFNVNFGSEIESLYGASWSCASGGTCSGVQIRFTQYDDEVDHYSTTDEDIANRAASILEIDLLDPSDNSELNVTGLSSPVSINMTATLLHADKVYDCFYWDTATSAWSQDGLTTIYHSSVLSECQTTHLTAFTLIAVDSPTTILATTLEVIETTDTDTTDTGAGSTATTEVSESGSGGLSTSVIIIIAVVVPVVLILIIVIAIIVVMMSKKSSKIGNADVENTQGNGTGNGTGTGTGGGLAPVEQAFSTPTRTPSTGQVNNTRTVQVADAAAPAPAPVAEEPVMEPLDLPGSPSPPPDGPDIDTIIRESENNRAKTPVDRVMTPVE